ncbi:MAG TPA: right-handed parallel beta-helix repeat-containing protein [Stellaceae bacterium]|jgi:hypothetical protein|nr:right-handed parallel beta-helix repeat-containing protein [Stellaceae bacterium]
MTRTAIVIAAGLALAATLQALPADAQNTRSFVSGQGSDLNNCSLAAPCRGLQRAHDETNAGGEIAVLDTAGYGELTINKAISIVNPGGVEAGIAVGAGTTGITINAGPTDVVSLRGLTLEGAGVGHIGIVFISGARLEIIDSVVRNFTSTGIWIQPITSTMSLQISNTQVLDNLNSAGIYLVPNGGQISHAAIDRVTADYNNYGIYIDTSGTNALVAATISGSVLSHNQNSGIGVLGGASAIGTQVYVRDSTLSANIINGFSISGTGAVLLSHATIVDSRTGVNIGAGSATVSSAGNNDLSANGTPVIGTLFAAPEQ